MVKDAMSKKSTKRPRGDESSRRRKMQRAWRRVTDAAASALDNVVGAFGPSPRPAVVPVRVDPERRGRRGV